MDFLTELLGGIRKEKKKGVFARYDLPINWSGTINSTVYGGRKPVSMFPDTRTAEEYEKALFEHLGSHGFVRLKEDEDKEKLRIIETIRTKGSLSSEYEDVVVNDRHQEIMNYQYFLIPGTDWVESLTKRFTQFPEWAKEYEFYVKKVENVDQTSNL